MLLMCSLCSVTESGEVLIDVLPLAVLLVRLLLEVGKEVAFHLITVKEVVPLIDYGLIAAAAEGFCLLTHTVVVVLFSLVLRLCIDVDAEGFMAHDLHGGLVPITRVVVEIEGNAPVPDGALAKGNLRTNVRNRSHINRYLQFVDIRNDSRYKHTQMVQREKVVIRLT